MKKPVKKMKQYPESGDATSVNKVAEAAAVYGSMYANPISILSSAKKGL